MSLRWCQLTSASAGLDMLSLCVCVCVFLCVCMFNKMSLLLLPLMPHTILVTECAVVGTTYVFKQIWHFYLYVCVCMCILTPRVVRVCVVGVLTLLPVKGDLRPVQSLSGPRPAWVVGRLCLSALLDPVIHQAQSRAQGTDHHLLQQVKNIEVTGKDLQPHTHTHTPAHAHTWRKKKKTSKLLATLSRANPSAVENMCMCMRFGECELPPGLIRGLLFLRSVNNDMCSDKQKRPQQSCMYPFPYVPEHELAQKCSFNLETQRILLHFTLKCISRYDLNLITFTPDVNVPPVFTSSYDLVAMWSSHYILLFLVQDLKTKNRKEEQQRDNGCSVKLHYLVFLIFDWSHHSIQRCLE